MNKKQLILISILAIITLISSTGIATIALNSQINNTIKDTQLPQTSTQIDNSTNQLTDQLLDNSTQDTTWHLIGQYDLYNNQLVHLANKLDKTPVFNVNTSIWRITWYINTTNIDFNVAFYSDTSGFQIINQDGIFDTISIPKESIQLKGYNSGVSYQTIGNQEFMIMQIGIEYPITYTIEAWY